MLAYGTKAQGEANRRALKRGEEIFVHKGEWMATGEDPKLSPTVFLIEQPANSTLEPHFHRQNQFQLFVHGYGKIGAHKLESVTIHYAGAYTGYGPLVAGEEGIQYFTIRPVCESGMIPVSTGRAQMIRGPKRHATAGPLALTPPEALQALSHIDVRWEIPMAEDGLGAAVVRMPPASTLRDVVAPQPAAEGAFVVVLAGSVRHGGMTLGPWENLFFSSDEAVPELIAGDHGAEVVFLFTPEKADAYKDEIASAS